MLFSGPWNPIRCVNHGKNRDGEGERGRESAGLKTRHLPPTPPPRPRPPAPLHHATSHRLLGTFYLRPHQRISNQALMIAKAACNGQQEVLVHSVKKDNYVLSAWRLEWGKVYINNTGTVIRGQK